MKSKESNRCLYTIGRMCANGALEYSNVLRIECNQTWKSDEDNTNEKTCYDFKFSFVIQRFRGSEGQDVEN